MADSVALRIKRDIVFNKVYWDLYRNETFLQIIYGGSSSGKSVDIAQRAVLAMVEEPDRNFLVVRNTANTLRQSCFTEIVKAITRFRLNQFFHCNESALIITCKLHGNQMFFRGLDDPQKLKSITPVRGVITDLWVEEATEISEQAFNDLLLRLRGRAPVAKRVILSFNPIYKTHWIYVSLFKGLNPPLGKIVYSKDKRMLILRTNYEYNRQNLDAEDIRTIESYNTPDDPNRMYWYHVYGLGEWGTLGDVIFTDWGAEDLSGREFPAEESEFGLDFGYSSDPAAFTQSWEKSGSLYVPRGIYQTHCTNPELAALIKPICQDEIVWCDCAEPKSIRELKTDAENRINAHSVKKGKDSVRHGIKWLQRHRIIVDETLQWLVNELSVCTWARDKHGQVLHPPKPVDAHNHGIDALRYGNERKIARVRMADLGSIGDENTSNKLKALMQENDTRKHLEMARR